MGSCFGRLFPHRTVVLVGLDSSGKSTILSNFIPRDTSRGAVSGISSTAGLKLNSFTAAGTNWKVWDMGGQGRYRHLWPSYYRHCDALVFVIDRLDVARIGVVRDEFRHMIEHHDVKTKQHPILVFLNKKDAEPYRGEHALTVQQVHKLVSFELARNLHQISVVECSGITGDGVRAGFNWLSQKV